MDPSGQHVTGHARPQPDLSGDMREIPLSELLFIQTRGTSPIVKWKHLFLPFFHLDHLAKHSFSLATPTLFTLFQLFINLRDLGYLWSIRDLVQSQLKEGWEWKFYLRTGE